MFDRYIGIDYSGAATPTSSLPGLRVYMADRTVPPVEIHPPRSPGKYWTRCGIAEWLVEKLRECPRTIVGIDHGFSFPKEYFEKYSLAHDWPAFLDDFQRHWPTDVHFVQSLREGNPRLGNSRWRRFTEKRAKGAKSVFQFDMQGSVAKSTHAGLPWLRFLREQVGEKTHFWPFDGWEVPAGKSALVEAYPRLYRWFPRAERSDHQQDAYSIAAWLQLEDSHGSLVRELNPSLTESDRGIARYEGWIIGVTGRNIGVIPKEFQTLKNGKVYPLAKLDADGERAFDQLCDETGCDREELATSVDMIWLAVDGFDRRDHKQDELLRAFGPKGKVVIDGDRREAMVKRAAKLLDEIKLFRSTKLWSELVRDMDANKKDLLFDRDLESSFQGLLHFDKMVTKILGTDPPEGGTFGDLRLGPRNKPAFNAGLRQLVECIRIRGGPHDALVAELLSGAGLVLNWTADNVKTWRAEHGLVEPPEPK